MSKVDSPAVDRIIANTINETARGDPDALASRIVAALAEAGFRIVPANGMEDAALRHQRAETQGSSTGAPAGIAGALPASRDGLGFCQAPGERSVGRSGERPGISAHSSAALEIPSTMRFCA